MLFLKQPLILLFFCHESAATCQIDSSRVSISSLKPDLCNCVNIEMAEFTAPSQQSHIQDTIFLDTLYIRERLKTKETHCVAEVVELCW